MSAQLGQPGQIIDGKYRIVRLLGTGGMGAVFEGENVRIRRRVAIKMLHSSVSTQADIIARFEREAQAAALVGSEHICEVLDLGMLPDQTRYMVMEYLEGETLSSLIKRHGRLDPAQSIPIVAQILDALGAAHAAGIIHRDLKPDNVFILPHKGGMQNFVKILDFGVSKFSQLGGESMNVTRAGAVVGTPYYMSPEQARGSSAIDQRTDIYAIGVLLYQATTGQVPYQAETFNELLFKIVLEAAPPPQTYVPDLDSAFAFIIQRAMSREPDQRFQSCQQFREALIQFQTVPTGPAFAPLTAHHGPTPFRTEVLDMSKLPGNLMSPPIDSGPGSAQSPQQSGASWAMASSPSNSPANSPSNPALVPGTASTGSSWGNASSPSNAQIRPRPRNGLLVGVVAVAALAGIGAAVAAFVMLGKGQEPRKTAASQLTVTTTATAPASVSSTSITSITSTTSMAAPPPASAAAPSATVEAQTAPSAAPSAEVQAAPSASTATSAKAASGGRVPGPMPGGAVTGKTGTGTIKVVKPVPKSSGNDLGY